MKFYMFVILFYLACENLDEPIEDGSSTENHSLLLVGDSSYAELTGLSALAIDSTITTEAWVKVDDWYNSWFSLIDDGTFNNMIQLNSNNEIQYLINSITYSLSYEIPLKSWFHIAVSFNDRNDSLKFYINGLEKLVLKTNSSNSIMKPTELYLGYNPSGAIEYSYGQIDELRIWNSIRSSDEIHKNYNKKLKTNERSLVVYLDFEDNSTKDKSLSNLGGKLFGKASIVLDSLILK